MAEASGNPSSPLALVLGAGDTRLDALDESMSFFFGDRGGDVGDELAGAVGTDLGNPAVGNRHGGLSVLAVLEKLLVDAAEPCEPRDLPHDDVLVLGRFDRVDQRGELLATGIGSGVTEVSVTVDVVRIDVALVELGIDHIALVGSLLSVGRGADVSGVASHSGIVFVTRRSAYMLQGLCCGVQ